MVLNSCIILDLYFPLEMSEVLKSLEQVVYGWFDLGLQLGLSDGVLHAIEHDYHRIGERKREMVWKWMNSAALNPTWCSLVNALHAIDMRVAAEKISKEHCKWHSACMRFLMHISCKIHSLEQEPLPSVMIEE